MTAPALELSGVHKRLGRSAIIRGVDLTVARGERHALIGPNGAGKSTLFELISGRLAPSAGRIRLNGRDIAGLPPERVRRLGLARSFQITSIFPALTVFENLRAALLQPRGWGHAFWAWPGRSAALTDEVMALLDRLGLAHRRDVPAGQLAYAEQRALDIGLAVAGDAPVVLLDEPTAGMSRAETARMVALIRDLTAGRSLLVVEHDMGVVFDLAERISVLVAGRVIASGPPDVVRADAEVQRAYLGALADA